MGSEESKPEPVPGSFNIYVTNKIENAEQIFVRLRGDKLQENEMHMRKLNEISVEISGEGSVGQGGEKGGLKVHNKHEEEKKIRQVYACLTQGGFTYLPPKKPVPFAVENIDRAMYISVHDGNTSWVWDFPVNPRNYGCVSVIADQNGCISAAPNNPEPCWMKVELKSLSTLDISGLLAVCQKPNCKAIWCRVCISSSLKWVGQLDSNQLKLSPSEFSKAYIRFTMNNLANPFKMLDSTDISGSSFDFLSTSEYEWLMVQRGHPIPPNAVKTNVSGANKDDHDVRYIGRVGGEYACGITEIDGRINHFERMGHSDTTSGEILILTK